MSGLPDIATVPWQPLALFAVGAVWGLLADRLAARWPAHDDASIRRPDWRTLVVAIAGGTALAMLPSRFSGVIPLAVFGLYALALIVLLATDLDQRLLPDVLTLPAIPVAAVFDLAALNPLVPIADLPFTIIVSVAVPGVLAVLAIPFGEGAIGLGDLKLLISAGLLAGGSRLVSGVVWGALLAGVVILVLLLARRVTLRSYVPFGPFLIAGVLWAILVAP